MDENNINRLPLLPFATVEGTPSCFDVSSVMRASFREHLQRDVSISKTKSMNKVYEEYDGKCSGIRCVEKEIMKTQGKIIMNAKEKNAEEIEDLPTEYVARYNLVSFTAIKSTASEQYLGELRVEPEGERNKMLKCLPPPPKGIDVFPPSNKKQDRSCIDAVQEWMTPHKSILDQRKPPLIVANRQGILYTDYAAGKTYHETLTLLNVSLYPCKFKLKPPQNVNLFDVTWTQPCSDQPRLLAPGLILNLDVAFHCKDLDDVYDAMYISFTGGRCYRVPIEAKRTPPCLKSACCLGVSKSDSTTEQKCLSFTIDCGFQLVGTKTEHVAVIYSTGPDSRFFITTELAWTFFEINDITDNGVVEDQPFSIGPRYFSLSKDSFINVNVAFSPYCEGTCTQRFFILCDNLTIRTIDVLGDGIMFYTDVIIFEGMEKNFHIDIEDDMEAEYYLNLGSIFTSGCAVKSFHISSDSQIGHKFHWEMRDAKVEGTTPIRKCLKVFPSSGQFSASSRTQFVVAWCADKAQPGTYRTVARLIVDNLTNECIKNSEAHLITNISANNVRATFQKHEITVYNHSNSNIEVEWEKKNTEGIVVFVLPETAEIVKRSLEKFNICVQFLQAGQIRDEIGCTLVHHDVYINVEIEGFVESDTFITSDIVDLGLVKQGSEARNWCYLFSTHSKEVSLNVRELSYEAKNGCDLVLTEMESTNLRNVPSTSRFIDPLYIDYLLDTHESKIILHLLEWSFGGELSYTFVIGDVQTTGVVLKPCGEVVLSNGPLYVGLHRSVQVLQLHNRTQLVTPFQWDPPLGQSSSLCQVNMLPDSDTLLPREDKEVLIIFYPNCKGEINDFTIPCYIELMSEPLTVSFTLFVEDISVLIVWDTTSGKREIHFPFEPITPNPSSDVILPDNTCSICYTPSKSESEIVENVEHTMLHYVGSDYSSMPYENWPIIGGKYVYDPFEDDILKTQFEEFWKIADVQKSFSSFSVETRDYLFEAFQSSALSFSVGILESVSKVLRVQNLTPIRLSIRTKVTGFPVTTETSMPNTSVIGAHSQTDVLKGDCFNEMLFGGEFGYGLVVCSDPEINELDSEGNVEVNITVKADLWGVYFDTLEISIGNLPSPFHVPLFVKVKGYPVYFTFAPETTNPKFSFGSLKHGQGLTHHFTLRNKTCLPLKIAWTTYAIPWESREEANLCIPDEKPPFGLGLDLHSLDELNFCSLKLMDYFGTQESCSYKVEPSVVYVAPMGDAQIAVTVRTEKCWFDIDRLRTDILGTAVGFVYVDTLDNESRYQKRCYRPDGFDLEPLKLHLSTKVQIPTLWPLNIKREDLKFKVRATDVFNSPKETFILEKKILFQNMGESVAYVSFFVDTPFEISRIRHVSKIVTANIPKFHALLLGGQVVEVSVVLSITSIELDRYFSDVITDVEYNSSVDSSGASSMCARELRIKQPGYIEQILELEYSIIKPQILLTKQRLTFGPVFINDTKVMSFRLSSQSGSEPFNISIGSGRCCDFIFRPTGGTVEQNYPIDVYVYFTPSECKSYFETLLVRTSVSSACADVILEGIGSWDYKWHYNDNPP